MKFIDLEFERQDNEKKCKAWLSLDGRTSLPDLGCLSVPGKRLELNRPPPNEHISKVYGLSRFRKCLLCPLAQKLVETQDLSAALPQRWLCGGARGPAAFFALAAVCKVSVTGREAASICSACHHRSQGRIMLLHHVTLPDSNHRHGVKSVGGPGAPITI